MSAANSELKVEGFSNGPLQMPGSASFNSPLKAALKRSFGKGENSGDFATRGTAMLPVPTRAPPHSRWSQHTGLDRNRISQEEEKEL